MRGVNLRQVLLICISVVFLFTLPIHGQNASVTGTIYGTILDQQNLPIGQAEVHASSNAGPGASASTSPDGFYRISNLTPGLYTLIVTKDGYTSIKESDISVTSGKNIQIRLILNRSAGNNGVVHGKVTDHSGAPIAGAEVVLESEHFPAMHTTSAADGFYEFLHLPEANYVVVIRKSGFSDLKPTRLELSENGTVEVNFQLHTKPAETPGRLLDPTSTGITWTITRDYMDSIPNNGSAQSVIEHLPGIQLGGFNLILFQPAAEPADFVLFSTIVTRGQPNYEPLWFYNGLDIKVPDAKYEEHWPTVLNNSSLQEIRVVTAGNDITNRTAGTSINLVTKQGGNRWSGNASFYFSNSHLQSVNQPAEKSLTGFSALDLKNLKEYGFDIGGPAIRNKLYIWSAYYKQELDSIYYVKNKSNSLSVKLDTSIGDHKLQLSYFRPKHHASTGVFFYDTGIYEETSREESSPEHILPGVISTDYSWVLNDETLLSARYGYVGSGYVDLSYLSGYNSGFGNYVQSYENSTHHVSAELNHFEQDWLGAEQDLHFGFEYSTSLFAEDIRSPRFVPFSLFYYTPSEGTLFVGYPQQPLKQRMDQVALYGKDSFQWKRLHVNAELRFDRQTFQNNSADFPSPLRLYGKPDFLGDGFELLFPDLHYKGAESPVVFDDLSPRVGSAFDLMGDNKTLISAQYARYPEAYDPNVGRYFNPMYQVGTTYNSLFHPEIFADYKDTNGDGIITLDEIGNVSGTDFAELLSKRLVDPSIKDNEVEEFVAGVERQLRDDTRLSASYLHRNYGNFSNVLYYGTSATDWYQIAAIQGDSPIGPLNVPVYRSDFQGFSSVILRNIRGYHRTYDALELSLTKHYSRQFSFVASLSIQKEEAHYDSSDASAFNPQGNNFDPTEIPFRDGRPYSPFASDWLFKFSGFYHPISGLNFGTFLRYQQGYPFNPLVNATSTAKDQIVEPIAKHRYSNIFIMDLRISYQFPIAQFGSLCGIMDIFNLTNASTVLLRNPALGVYDVEQGLIISDHFRDAEEFLAPRIFRLGLRYSF